MFARDASIIGINVDFSEPYAIDMGTLHWFDDDGKEHELIFKIKLLPLPEIVSVS